MKAICKSQIKYIRLDKSMKSETHSCFCHKDLPVYTICYVFQYSDTLEDKHNRIFVDRGICTSIIETNTYTDYDEFIIVDDYKVLDLEYTCHYRKRVN